MTKYTKEQRKQHNAKLRQQWQEAKAASQGNGEIDRIFKHLESMGITHLSATNIALVLQQAEEQGLEGLPYIDFKTYDDWKKSGFQVRKGEKSPVFSITWVGPKQKEDDSEPSTWRFPRLTRLFHSSQVDER